MNGQKIIGKELVLKVTSDKVFYSSDYFISLSDTNFPVQHNKFYDRTVLYWSIRCLDFLEEQGLLECDIIDYESNHIEKFLNQKAKGSLKRILFKKLACKPLEKHMQTYMPSNFDDFYYNDDDNRIIPSDKRAIPYRSFSDNERTFFPSTIKVEKNNYEINIEYPINKLKFFDGSLEFLLSSKYVSNLTYKFKVSIYQSSIKEIYNPLIPYFKKVLNKTHLNVLLSIEEINNQIIGIKASSMEIESLPSYLEKANAIFSISQIKKAKSIEKINQIDSILTINTKTELLDHISNILAVEKSIHTLEIKHLAEISYYSPSLKVTVFSKPDLSFLFLIVAKAKIHFILETYLIDHATYIWSYNKYNSDQIDEKFLKDKALLVYEEIDKIIGFNRHNYRNQLSPQNFAIVEHDNSEEGFKNWLSQLEEIIV